MREELGRNKRTKEGKGSLIRTENECQEALLLLSVQRKSCLVALMACGFSSWARFIG